MALLPLEALLHINMCTQSNCTPSNTFNYHPKYTNKTILHISRTHLRTHYLSYTLNAHTTATSNQNTNTNYFILSRFLQTKVCSSQIFIYHTYNYIYIQNKSFNTNIYNQQTTHMFTMNILWTHRLSKTNYTVVSWATPHKKKKIPKCNYTDLKYTCSTILEHTNLHSLFPNAHTESHVSQNTHHKPHEPIYTHSHKQYNLTKYIEDYPTNIKNTHTSNHSKLINHYILEVTQRIPEPFNTHTTPLMHTYKTTYKYIPL